MASIHLRPKTKFYSASFLDPHGNWRLVSTKQTNKAAAMATALEFERAARAARSHELTEAQARKVLTNILEMADNGEHLRAPSAEAFFKEWLAGKTAARSESTAIRYKQTVDGFLAHLGECAARPLSSLTARDVQSFTDSRLRGQCAPATVRVDLKTLQAAFNRARRLGLIPSNPAEAIDLPQSEGMERGTFTSAEIKLLVAAADGEWKTLILCGYYLGARLKDCCKIAWTDIDLTAGTVRIKQSKTAKEILLPIHKELLAHLEKLASTDEGGAIMPHMATVRTSGRRGLSEQFIDLMRAAGLEVEQVDGAGKRRMHKRSFHSLRHSMVSALAAADVSKETRMALSGHSSESAHKVYTHLELKTLRDAIERLTGLE